MKTVKVSASGAYDVIIGRGILHDAGQLCSGAVRAKKIALVCDSNVAGLYADPVEKSLCSAGFDVSRFEFPAGEESKCSDVYISLLEFLAGERLTRKDCVAALGGGVTGDLAGFAAATYLRGIDFIQIPTTLLAAVDSSVGGKTGIDLAAGKNLAGAFHQPKIVICDTETLSTLDPDTFACGMAEVIKYGVIRDAELFSLLEDSSRELLSIPGGHADENAWNILEDVVAACVGIKRDVVEADEFEGGVRQILNFGHTAAHSIEKISGYKIPHGAAVAVGMIIAAKFAVRETGLSADSVDRITALNRAYGLPVTVDGCAEMYDTLKFSNDAMIDAALHDKKCAAGEINLILPDKIGYCSPVPVPICRLNEFFM